MAALSATRLHADAPDPTPLPPLRQDLRLIRGSAEGSAKGERDNRWKIHDPIAHRFFEVDQNVVDILALWRKGTAGELIEQVWATTGRDLSSDEVRELLDFLKRNELLQPQPGLSYARACSRRNTASGRWWRLLLHSYLFARIPLARPDRFLRTTMPLASLFFRPFFWWFTAGVGGIGLYLVSRQWETFLTSLPEMFSVAGVTAFAICLALTKTLHELGHGYTATRMGTYVSSMGVALIVLFPVLYTDTTDAWRLRNRRQRVLIDLAGIAVELMVAVYATILWVFLPDGPVRYAVFALATTGWVLSLLVNLNPLMRFDGYYLFSDMLGIANLQERSFAMGRWWLRESLFGYGDRQPEVTSVSRRRFFIGFAFAVWIYRFFLFLGIALLVYHFFFKALGLVLFLVEIAWFILLPIGRELLVWWRRRKEINRRAYWTASFLLAAMLILLAPLPHTVRIPAVLGAAQQYPGFSPRPARVEEVLVQEGDRVDAGQLLVKLSAPELVQEVKTARERSQLLQNRIGRRSADSRDLSESLVLASELEMERERLDGLEREQTQLEVRSKIPGVVVELGEHLHPGRWVDTTTRLALVAQPETLRTRGYLNSEDLMRVKEGAAGQFIDQQFLMSPLDVEIIDIAGAASVSLDNWVLASVHGGVIPSRQENDTVRAERAVFEITARVEGADPILTTEQRGEIQLRGEPTSLAARFFTRVVRVLLRELAV